MDSIRRNSLSFIIYSIFIAVLMLCDLPAKAQHSDRSDRLKPSWMSSKPIPGNTTFVYLTVSSSASSLSEARQNCFSEMLSEAGLEKGVLAKTDYKSLDQERTVWNNDVKNELVESSFQVISTVKGKQVEIIAIGIDEYWERKNGQIYLTTLYARSQLDTKPRFDSIHLTTKYGCRGLWRSAIVPGWGQMYKGSYLKGGLVLGGFVGCIAGVVFTESQRGVYLAKVGKTHDTNAKKSYVNSASNLATGRNVCIGAAAALYVYGLIDAIVAPGARRVVITPSADSRSIGVSASVRF